MKANPYRVIVWGPGAVGQASLRELVKRPELKIVGVLAYSPSKVGKDVGELIGHPPIGVRVTGGKEAIFALDADCVIYTGTWPRDIQPSMFPKQESKSPGQKATWWIGLSRRAR